SFTGQNAHVFKSAESADRQFAEDVEAIKERHGGRSDLKRAIRGEITTSETNEWQNNQGAISQEHGKSTDVVHPFAYRYPANAGPSEAPYQYTTDERDTPWTVSHPSGGIAQGIGNVRCDKHSAQGDHQ